MSDHHSLPPLDFSEQPYIDSIDFLEIFKKNSIFPYPSTYSFSPFQKSYQKKIAQLGIQEPQYFQHWIDQAHQVNGLDIAQRNQVIQEAISHLLPDLLVSNDAVFLSTPFAMDFIFASPMLQEYLFTDKWEVKIPPQFAQYGVNNNIFQASTLILNKFYNFELEEWVSKPIITLREKATGLEKHFHMKIDFSYVEIKALKPIPQYTKEQLHQLFQKVGDPTAWTQYFPVDHFAFEGFAIGLLVDVTKVTIQNALKDEFNNEDVQSEPSIFLGWLNKYLKDYLGTKDLKAGFSGTLTRGLLDVSFSLTGESDIDQLTNKGGIYDLVNKAENRVVCENLSSLDNPSFGEQKLLDKGFRSAILFQPSIEDHNATFIFEIASTTPNEFNSLTLFQLDEVFDIFQSGTERYFSEIKRAINIFIQDQFTSIHPSVSWRFEEVANNYLLGSTLPNFNGRLEEIVFEDVYPLYGQADIVSSSNLRNDCIKTDLLDNLNWVKRILEEWSGHLNLFLLSVYMDKVDQLTKNLNTEFNSKDETEVVEVLNEEIHPYMDQLSREFEDLPKELYQDYQSYVDPSLNIVYNKRKEYEESVSRLNLSMANHLEKENNALQKILPHYFEKYKTDGVEYNMYVGQSMLEQGTFTNYHLKEFRLWQLIKMCEITRLVNELGPQLPIPLTTAQLVFVYNGSLNIRFRMDEKQFDVDGTYNVRYEILKKRIDKAIVKGVGQRLTQAGKMAIVYLQEKDRHEYLSYCNYLQAHGYIKGEIEDLELDKMQGASGIRALRFTVS